MEINRNITKTLGVTTKRLEHEGYAYSIRKRGIHRVSYRCICYRSKKCHGTLSTDKHDADIKIGLPHNHPPSSANTLDMQKKLHALKLKAFSCHDSAPESLLKTFRDSLTDEQYQQMPKKKALKRMIGRMRPCSRLIPGNSNSLLGEYEYFSLRMILKNIYCQGHAYYSFTPKNYVYFNYLLGHRLILNNWLID